MPQRTIIAHDKDFQPSISTWCHDWRTSEATARSALREPGCPAVVRCRLPDMPQRAIASASIEFESPIGILGQCRCANQPTTRSALREPGCPAVVRCCLPAMPQRTIIAHNKDFQPSISVLCHSTTIPLIGVCIVARRGHNRYMVVVMGGALVFVRRLPGSNGSILSYLNARAPRLDQMGQVLNLGVSQEVGDRHI